MDRHKCQILRNAMNAALSAIAAELNVSFIIGAGSYDETTFRVKVEVAEKDSSGRVQDKKGNDFKRYCSQFGLKESDLGRTFNCQNRTFTICGIAPRSWKNPILASCGGKVYKFSAMTVKSCLGASAQTTINSVFVAPKARRTEAEIIDAIREVEGQLSPENLSCDGEAPATWVRREGARLRALRAQLVHELGREPSYEEIWPRSDEERPFSTPTEQDDDEDDEDPDGNDAECSTHIGGRSNPGGLTTEEAKNFAEFRKTYGAPWKPLILALWNGNRKPSQVMLGQEMLDLKDKLKDHYDRY